MPTTTYTAADTPVIVSPQAGYFFQPARSEIVVPSVDGVITDITCDIQVTSPDSNPQTLLILLYEPNFSSIALHSESADDISSVNYDNDRNPATGSMNDFNGISPVGTWFLELYNSDMAFEGTLNLFALNITYDVPPQLRIPNYPDAPAAVTIPGNVRYGDSAANIKQNMKVVFNVDAKTGKVIDGLRYCPINAKIQNLVVTCKNTGATTSTIINMHRVINGVDVVILSQKIIIGTGYTFSARKFFPSKVSIDDVHTVYNNDLNKGDFVYFTIEQSNNDLSDLAISLILNKRD